MFHVLSRRELSLCFFTCTENKHVMKFLKETGSSPDVSLSEEDTHQ